MSWYLEYRSVQFLPDQDILFLSKFECMQDFYNYCFWKLPEDYFLINDKISFERVLTELTNVQKESKVSNA